MRHTDEELHKFLYDDDSSVDLSGHFSEVSGDWCDVAMEGIRIFNLMGEAIEPDDPRGEIIHAVAAQSAHGAIDAVASALGVEGYILEQAVEQWYTLQGEVPAPIGAEALLHRIAQISEEAQRFDKRLRELQKDS